VSMPLDQCRLCTFLIAFLFDADLPGVVFDVNPEFDHLGDGNAREHDKVSHCEPDQGGNRAGHRDVADAPDHVGQKDRPGLVEDSDEKGKNPGDQPQDGDRAQHRISPAAGNVMLSHVEPLGKQNELSNETRSPKYAAARLRFANINMPDDRSHRGPHPEDARLFAPSQWPGLRDAVADFSWLLGRGYGDVSALKLVGDRYRLDQRQRKAVTRSACTDEARALRLSKQGTREELAGRTIHIDGYNVLTTIEAALGGGVVLVGRDTLYRDIAGLHGTWRRVEETIPALRLVGQTVAESRVMSCIWYLDRPVSNSGRLSEIVRGVAAENGWNWEVLVVPNPDNDLAGNPQIIATADSIVLDRCIRWFGLARAVITAKATGAYIVDLSSTT